MAATSGLKVEAGMKTDCTARLSMGLRVSVFSARHRSGSIPPTKSFGSKDGWE